MEIINKEGCDLAGCPKFNDCGMFVDTCNTKVLNDRYEESKDLIRKILIFVESDNTLCEGFRTKEIFQKMKAMSIGRVKL